MSYLTVGQRTFLELMSELEDILETDRYDVPSLIKTDLKAAKILIAAADDSFINDMLTTLSLFLLPLEDKINTNDIDFFKRLEVCKHCEGDHNSKGCVCVAKCHKKCKCPPTCINCSEVLKELDSKTFNAIKYIVDQAADGGDDEKEDIEVIFKYIKTICAIVKSHKKR